MIKQFKLITKCSLVAAMALTSCSSDDDSIVSLTPEEIVENLIGDEVISSATKSAFITNYAEIVAANYSDTYTTAVTMQTAIDAFIATPSETTLEAAQDAWLYARDFYGQTEAFREANGPIDVELGTEGQINAWPLDEGYIDYVYDSSTHSYVNNGLIGDDTFVITEDNIIAKNEDGGDANISTGWHAIEFLLWGQDFNLDSSHSTDYSVSGTRDYTDYTTADYATRRATYLEVVTDLLVSDLKDLQDIWVEGGSYRTTFESLDSDEALTNILNGIGFISNGEIALERIDPAIDEGQENEHSCFSDNTNQDMWANVNGINNIITGKYTKEDGTVLEGTSLVALVANLDTDYVTAADLASKSTTTLSKLQALLDTDKTFDAIIAEETLGSNGVAGQLSSALKSQGTSIAESASTLDITITIN